MTGSVPVTVVPPPGPDVTPSSPPTAASRSAMPGSPVPAMTLGQVVAWKRHTAFGSDEMMKAVGLWTVGAGRRGTGENAGLRITG